MEAVLSDASATLALVTSLHVATVLLYARKRALRTIFAGTSVRVNFLPIELLDDGWLQ